MSERYDIAIIGTGPAGLSAAITSKIRNKNIILFGGDNCSKKVHIAYEIKNYLGFPNIKGEELAKRFEEHLKSMNIDITNEVITMIYTAGDYFSILSKSNNMYEASAVIIATGVDFKKPYEGENEFLGRGVSYCATCDAPLFKDKTVAVIAESKKDEAEAEFVSELAKKVYYIPIYEEEVTLCDGIETIREAPLSIKGDKKADVLVLERQELEVDGIFILREGVMPCNLIPGIKMCDNYIEVNRRMETNIKGCFACGDIVGAPYQYIKSAGEGNIAALSAVSYIDSL